MGKKRLAAVKRRSRNCVMWKDQDLHKLFRSHLPIADLPATFAAHLTHTILTEVAALRQGHALANDSANAADGEDAHCQALPEHF
jgi:hypothetical protein